MTQKDTIISILKSLDKGTFTKNEVCELVQSQHPTYKRNAINFYAKELIAIGEFEFKPTTIKINSDSLIKDENIMTYSMETIDMDNIDMSKFTAVATGTPVDKIMSKRNGWMPGTVYVVTGESGAGKTTVCTNIADYTTENNPDKTAGFISCEMDRMDWTEECLDNPRLSKLPTLFMLEYLEASNYDEILIDVISKYDLIILDSFEVVIDQLKEIKGWTSKKAETKLLDLLRTSASTHGTTILVIQQFTKGGNFVGSNKIKHLLTGMLFVNFDKDGNRYIVFTKNRRAGHMVGKPMYFTKSKESGRLIFDGDRYENEEAYVEMKENEVKSIEDEKMKFQDMLIKAKSKSTLFTEAENARNISTIKTTEVVEAE